MAKGKINAPLFDINTNERIRLVRDGLRAPLSSIAWAEENDDAVPLDQLLSLIVSMGGSFIPPGITPPSPLVGVDGNYYIHINNALYYKSGGTWISIGILSGGGAGSVLSVSGNIVDNTDPTNPVVDQLQSDWGQADNTSPDYIKNKPSIPAAQIQSDWNQTNNLQPDYIKNKPGIILPYISIAWGDVYSATMTGAGSLVEGQLYRVTGIPLFPLGYGIKTGYFMAYANRTDATPRVYLNSQGYGRLWQYDALLGSAPSGLTAVVEIDWYLSTGAQAGSPEWFSFEVPEWNQKSHRTYDTAQTINDAIFVVEWGTIEWKGINFHDVKLLKWDKTSHIYQCQIERTTIDNNNSENFVLKWSHVIANKLTVRANSLTVSEHDIYAPSEDLNIGFSTQYGRYSTGLQGNIKLRLNWNTAFDNVDKLTIPQYADLIGIFELYDEEKQAGTVTQIVGGYSTTTPFLLTEALAFGSIASFQPYSFSTEDATHNIWQTILTDQLNIFSAYSLDKTRTGTKLLLSYYDNTAAATRNDMVRIESAYITA